MFNLNAIGALFQVIANNTGTIAQRNTGTDYEFFQAQSADMNKGLVVERATSQSAENVEQARGRKPLASDGMKVHQTQIAKIEKNIGFDSQKFIPTSAVINDDGSTTETFQPYYAEDAGKLITVTTSADKSTKTIKYIDVFDFGDNKPVYRDNTTVKIYPQYIHDGYTWGISIEDHLNDEAIISN